MIKSFRNEYYFLSNFYPCKIEYRGFVFDNAESAFQAQKNPIRAKDFVGLTGAKAKKLGRKVALSCDWNMYKDRIMSEIVMEKFLQNPDLREKLINTRNMDLVEYNKWGDTYWGVCDGVGENKLGKILKYVRNHFIEKELGSNKKGRLYLKSISDKNIFTGIKINIARSSMNNIEIRFIELAPSKELFNWYINLKNNNNLYEGWFEDYRKVYMNQLKNNEKALKSLKALKIMLEEGFDIAVYCFCKDVSKCHRSIIGNLFEKKGFEVIR